MERYDAKVFYTGSGAMKEATARIKINNLLETAGWRFFQEGTLPANIQLEPSVTIKTADLEALGENFEKTGKGFIDFLLLDAKGFPLVAANAMTPSMAPTQGPREKVDSSATQTAPNESIASLRSLIEEMIASRGGSAAARNRPKAMGSITVV